MEDTQVQLCFGRCSAQPLPRRPWAGDVRCDERRLERWKSVQGDCMGLRQ